MHVATRKFEPEPLLVSIPQAATRLGTTVSAVRNLLWDGQLPFVRLGKRHLVRIADVDGWIAKNLTRNGA